MSNANQTDSVTCPVGERVVMPEVPNNFFEQFPAPSPGRRYSTLEVAIKISAYVIVMLICAVGNVLVIIIVVTCKRMRTSTNLHVCNMAISDLMVALLCMWVHLGANITADWPFTAEMCKVNNFFQAWSVTASVLFLAAIAADRYVAIVHPLRTIGSRKNILATVQISAVWILSALVAGPHLFTWRLLEVQWKDRLERVCIDEWPQFYYLTTDGLCLTHKPSRDIYVTTHVVILYFLPVAVMTYAYGIIAHSLWQRKLPTDGSTGTVVKRRKKVVRMMIVVFLVFFICWTPQQVTVLYDTYRPLNHAYPDWFVHIFKYTVTFVAYTNSAINPILYGVLNDNFRQGFRQAFKCTLATWRHRITPAMTATSHLINVKPVPSQTNAVDSERQRF